MPKLIQDQFTSMPVSRQRKYQLRREALGLCRLCGEPATDGLCETHRVLSRIQAKMPKKPKKGKGRKRKVVVLSVEDMI